MIAQGKIFGIHMWLKNSATTDRGLTTALTDSLFRGHRIKFAGSGKHSKHEWMQRVVACFRRGQSRT